MSATKTSYITCPLCEATCGLEIVTQGHEVVSIRGDAQDVFSHGYICPKAASLKELHSDPDIIRQPMLRRGDEWLPVSWEEAFADIEQHLLPILQEHGRNALGVYVGNPNVHQLDNQLYLPVLLKAAGTQNIFSASTVDQMPKQVSAAHMFGAGLSIPVPDVDHTDYLLLLGANPLVSNGSLMTAPDMRGRLRRLRQRGGKLVVIDPYRTRTAEEADAHHFIRPGSDALLLFGMLRTLFAEGLVKPGRLADHLNGLEQIRDLAQQFAPETVAAPCGLAPDTIRQLARDLAAAPRAAVYGRIGTCTQEFGTLVSWLVDVLNALTGNLDRAGGALFPRAAAGARNTNGTPGIGKATRFGRRKSRVRGLPEFFGELPVVCMAEEIETPGPGQIRALITVAGNPVLSTPNSGRLDAALGTLDYMISLDMYLNETTRHANVILPPPPDLTRSHYDLAFYQLSIRNIAHYSAPIFPPEPGTRPEWDTWLRLSAILLGQGASADPALLDDLTITTLIQRDVATPDSSIEGRDTREILAALAPRRGPERLLDYMLRSGPYGDGFTPAGAGRSAVLPGSRGGASSAGGSPAGAGRSAVLPGSRGGASSVGGSPAGAGRSAVLPGGRGEENGVMLGALSLAQLEGEPHGVDLGPLQPRIPEVLRTPSGKVELAPPALVADVERLHASLARPSDGLLLIGRRDLRSNNSWMHNLHTLTKGKNRCTLHMHPSDAARLGVAEGDTVHVASRAGSVEAPVELTENIMPGVVSLPHGWGHNQPGARLSTAAQHPGVNANVLTDELCLDPLSGNAALNGIAVTIRALATAH